MKPGTFNLVLRSVVGFGAIIFFGDLAHDEIVRAAAERNVWVALVEAGFVVIAALIVPGLNDAIEDGGNRGARLFSLGRRAYDGKLAAANAAAIPDIEVPPHA